MCPPSLTFPSETGQPPQCEEGLRTLTFEKLVPGGIAEVSPLRDPADGRQEAPGFGRGSNAGPDLSVYGYYLKP